MVLNILVINYEFPPIGGGAGNVSYELSKSYAKLGHKVDIITSGFKGLPNYEKKDGLNIYRVKCLRSKKEICNPLEMLSFLLSAKKFLKKHLINQKYDINHTHFAIPSGVLSYYLEKKYGIPYMITSHGSDLPGYNPDRFKLLHFFTKPLLRLIINSSGGAYAGSKYLAELGNKIGLIKNYEVMRDGFDSSKFMPKKKKKIIFSSGRLLKRKGFHVLLNSVCNKKIDYEVHIAGDGPMMQNLKKIALKSKTKIIFHGWIDNKSKAYKDLIEKSSIYVLDSERENSSVSLLEAMSAGCAIITSNVSGCPEIIDNSGIVITPNNEACLREKLELLLNNPKLIKKYSINARKRVITEFNSKKAAENYIKTLKKSVKYFK